MTFPLLSNCKIHAERTSINNLVIESIILLVLDPFVISSKLEVPLHFRQSYFWAILFSDHKPATDNQNNVTKPNAEKSFVQEGEYSILFSYFEAVTRWKRERSEVQVRRIIRVSLFFFFFSINIICFSAYKPRKGCWMIKSKTGGLCCKW